jgi:hypothetical protein
MMRNGNFSKKLKLLNLKREAGCEKVLDAFRRQGIVGSPQLNGPKKLRPPLRSAEPAPVLEPEFTEDDTAWPERCEQWLAVAQKPHRRRALRERSASHGRS